MSHSLPTVFYTSIRMFGYVVMGLMGLSIVYAGITAVLNWTQIAV